MPTACLVDERSQVRQNKERCKTSELGSALLSVKVDFYDELNLVPAELTQFINVRQFIKRHHININQ